MHCKQWHESRYELCKFRRNAGQCLSSGAFSRSVQALADAASSVDAGYCCNGNAKAWPDGDLAEQHAADMCWSRRW